MQTIKGRYARIFLILGCLAVIYGHIDAQSGRNPRNDQRPKNSKASKINKPSGTPLPAKDVFPPELLAVGDVGLTFNGTSTTTITGTVRVVGLDHNQKPHPLTSSKKQLIQRNFDFAMDNWKITTANVCGSEVQLNPALSLEFDDSFTKPKTGENILYVEIGTSELVTKTGKHLHGASYPGLRSVEGVRRFAKLRGTGKLPPFTFLMPDPEVVKESLYKRCDGVKFGGDLLWELTAIHEFGHALGLYDTYFDIPDKLQKPGTCPRTDEVPRGYMNLAGFDEYKLPEAYIAEVITRVFECRLDVTASIKKTIVWPPVETIYQWDFLGRLSTKYEGAFTSQWAYFNGISNTRNYCTVPNRMGETSFKNIPVNTYQPCTAMPELNNGDDIDFNLAEFTTSDGYLWEEFIAPPVSFDSKFEVGAGDCKDPVSISGSGTPGILPVITPVFTLGTDGKQSWLVDVNVSVSGGASADHNDPDRSDCAKTFSFSGRPVQISEKKPLGPVVATSKLTSLGADVGEYTVEVKMKLAPKSAGSRFKK